MEDGQKEEGRTQNPTDESNKFIESASKGPSIGRLLEYVLQRPEIPALTSAALFGFGFAEATAGNFGAMTVSWLVSGFTGAYATVVHATQGEIK